MHDLVHKHLVYPLAVVAHDAGAANLLFYWLKQHADLTRVRFYVSGPAEKILNVVLPELKANREFDDYFYDSSMIITGSGWASDVEFNAIKQARERNIFSIACVDHWVNYRQRFIRNNVMVLPNQIWVTDQYAKQIALVEFPSTPVFMIDNCYLNSQLTTILDLPKKNGVVLYVLEPIRADWGGNQLPEFDALDFFISKIGKLGSVDLIRLRLHPSESIDKYQDWIIKNATYNIVVDDSKTIAEAISKSSIVVGCETFAMVVGLAAGRDVYCSLPPWAPECRLPHQGIMKIKDFGETV